MKTRRRGMTWVKNDLGLWWHSKSRRWVDPLVGEELLAGVSTARHFRTVSRARRHALEMGGGFMFVHFFWRRGQRWAREYYVNRPLKIHQVTV